MELVLSLVIAAFLAIIPLVQIQLLFGFGSFLLLLSSQACSIANPDLQLKVVKKDA